MKWREYQEEAASFFRKLGLAAKVEFALEGARGIHVVDVYVEGDFYGINFKWVVECKAWKSSIPKEKVMALASIIQDIGADRGFLLSETGFQSGAIRSAQKTNITLSSLEDLAEIAGKEAADTAMAGLHWRLQKARNRLRTIKKAKFDDYYYPPMVEHLGELLILEHVLHEAIKDGFPLLYRKGLEITSFDELLNFAENVIAAAECWEPPGERLTCR